MKKLAIFCAHVVDFGRPIILNLLFHGVAFSFQRRNSTSIEG